MSDYGLRLKYCVDILDSFPKNSKSLTVHVEEYFKNIHIIEEERLFVIDVFAETIKYHKILSAVIDKYYQFEGRTVFVRDTNLYFVLLFLIVFRLDEIGMDNLKRYCATQQIKDMYKFLNFFLDENNLFTWIDLEWRKLYDPIFVENEFMGPLRRWLPELNEFVADMKDTLDNKPHKQLKRVPVTKPDPFKLTAPKPRRIPIPEMIPAMEKVKEVPASTYIPPIQDSKQPKKDPKQLLKEAEKLKPSCADKTMSSKTMDKMKKIVEEREKDLSFGGIKARPVPKRIEPTEKVKLTTAAILREWKLYQNRQIKQNEVLKKLEEGTFNSQKFEEWQQSVRATDLAENLAQIEKRRLEGKISYEEAIIKRENLVQENKAVVEALKKENEKRLDLLNRRRIVEHERLKLQVEQISANQENVREARLAVENEKKSIVRQMADESKRLQEEALIEAEVEMRRKIEIIAEIRALEGSQNSSQKVIDQTQVAGYGLLCEMSLAELKERLVLSKKKYEEDLNVKKEKLLDDKLQKEKLIETTMEKIEIYRSKNKESDKKEPISEEKFPDSRLKEIEDLRTCLEEKKVRRMKKQNVRRDKANLKSEQTSFDISRKNTELMDNYGVSTRSETLNKIAEILSV